MRNWMTEQGMAIIAVVVVAIALFAFLVPYGLSTLLSCDLPN